MKRFTVIRESFSQITRNVFLFIFLYKRSLSKMPAVVATFTALSRYRFYVNYPRKSNETGGSKLFSFSTLGKNEE